MLQALSALLGAGMTIAACYAAGAMLMDRLGLRLRRLERLALGFTLGAACLHLAVFLILTAQIAYWPVFAALEITLIGSAIALGAWKLGPEAEPPVSQNLKRLCIVLFGSFSVVYFFHAWAPEISPDGSGYHLGYVAAYVRAHGFERVTTDMYAALSEGMEMLFVPAFAIGQHSAAALVHLAFTAATALLLFEYGRRLGKPWVGATAAILVYASPVVGIDGSSAYTDLGVAAVVFSAFYWLDLWEAKPTQTVLVIPAGLLAGYAYAIKYTAFLVLIFALGLVLVKGRKLRPALTLVLFSSLMVAPWMIKNWIIFHNPIAPFGDSLFRNPYFHPMFEKTYGIAMRWYDVLDKRTLPLEVILRGGKTQGLLGIIFFLSPLALLALRFRPGRRLLLLGLLLGLPYYFNFGTRFLIPALPFVSMAMALALANWPAALAAMMIVHAAASWPSEITRYSDPYVWRLEGFPVLEALRMVPQDKFLRDQSQAYEDARLVEKIVPKGERILGTEGVAYAYCNRQFLIDYQGALNQTLIDTMDVAWIDDFQPNVLQSFKFPERKARRFRILQTAPPETEMTQWSVHEMRFFYQGKELPRQADWRLRAWPNPWEVQLAFDNSLATRWRTWETVAPGDYLDVDFNREETVDEIRLDTSLDCASVKLQAEAMDAGRAWALLKKDPQVSVVDHKNYSLRMAATYEMKARGLHYLIIGNDFYGAADYEDDPKAWGLTLVAVGARCRIYKVAE